MPAPPVLISRDRIERRVAELGAAISRDYPSGPLYLIGVLKGACFFLADLARAIETPVRIDFVRAASYGAASISSGEVQLTKDLESPIEGRHVILVEDIVDTGVTLSYLRRLLAARGPKSLKLAALLDKPERRRAPLAVDYLGFEIPDRFVVGYGLDHAEDYRNLPDVCVLE